MNPRAAGHIELQPLLAASSALVEAADDIRPHHPVTCSGPLRYDEACALGCDHASVPADDRRTQFCVTYSLSLLLIELVHEL